MFSSPELHAKPVWVSKAGIELNGEFQHYVVRKANEVLMVRNVRDA